MNPTDPPQPTSAPTPPAPSFLTDIDQLLRGRFTGRDAQLGQQVTIPVRTLLPACLGFGALYGLSMGLFSSLSDSEGGSWLQLISSAGKVPLLFLLTLLVTFPSLYVVSALARSRLSASNTLRLLLAAVAVNLILLASLAPVAAFFTLSTDSYPFMKLLHVVFFAVGGIVGLGVLWRALTAAFGWDQAEEPQPGRPEPATTRAARPAGDARGVSEAATDSGPEPGPDPPAVPAVQPARVPAGGPPPAVRTYPVHSRLSSEDLRVRRVFRTWMVIFGCVGAQMAWILRPFLGSPDQPFAWFRPRDSNFLMALFETLAQLFG